MNGSRALPLSLAIVATLTIGLSGIGLPGIGLPGIGALGASSGVAYAQSGATVRVAVTDRAGETADAWVTLTPEEGGTPHDCRTQNGACEITGVPPGRYVVTATPSDGGRPPLPRVVPVPTAVPSIELRVRLL